MASQAVSNVFRNSFYFQTQSHIETMVSDVAGNTSGLEKRVNKIEDKLLGLQVIIFPFTVVLTMCDSDVIFCLHLLGKTLICTRHLS